MSVLLDHQFNIIREKEVLVTEKAFGYEISYPYLKGVQTIATWRVVNWDEEHVELEKTIEGVQHNWMIPLSALSIVIKIPQRQPQMTPPARGASPSQG